MFGLPAPRKTKMSVHSSFCDVLPAPRSAVCRWDFSDPFLAVKMFPCTCLCGDLRELGALRDLDHLLRVTVLQP